MFSSTLVNMKFREKLPYRSQSILILTKSFRIFSQSSSVDLQRFWKLRRNFRKVEDERNRLRQQRKK